MARTDHGWLNPQGHSKNPAGDDCDGFGAVLAEVFACLAHGQALGTDQGQGEISNRGKCAAAGPDAAAVFVHRHVADVMQAVLDAPMGAHERQQPIGTGFDRGQAGDEVGDLGTDLVADAALAPDARDLGRTGPVEVLDDLGADRDAARLDAAVRLVERFRAGEVRRQRGGDAAGLAGGKDRRSSRRWRLSARAGCP